MHNLQPSTLTLNLNPQPSTFSTLYSQVTTITMIFRQPSTLNRKSVINYNFLLSHCSHLCSHLSPLSPLPPVIPLKTLLTLIAPNTLFSFHCPRQSPAKISTPSIFVLASYHTVTVCILWHPQMVSFPNHSGDHKRTSLVIG